MKYDHSIDLAEFESDARELGAEEFAARHGRAFLVRSAVDGPLQEPKPLSGEDWMRPTTDVLGTVMSRRQAAGESGDSGNQTGFFVYPVRKRRGDDEGKVTVGRTPNNDIRIGDVSVSKTHAEFEADGDGNFRLTDLGSRNGTRIGGDRLAPGRAYDVPFGKTVQFGEVRLTYLRVAQFLDFVKFAIK